jgi:hypothetical protein
MTDLLPLGLDIAKATFSACLIRESGKLRHSSFPTRAADITFAREPRPGHLPPRNRRDERHRQ